jgi:cell wall assembly regulator SMI1
MRDLNELNLNEGGEPVTRPAPSVAEITLLEQELEAKLPQDYLDFLQFSNGGHPEVDTFYVTTGRVVQDWGISRFFNLTPEQPSSEELTHNLRWFWAEVANGLLPIANDGGGNLICLDLRDGSYGSILLWVHDVGEKGLFIPVADSFGELMDSLEVNPDYI